MKKITTFISLLLISSSLYALDVTESLGSENGTPYVLLTLEDSSSFECLISTHETNDKLICKFDKVPALKPTPFRNSFFEIDTDILDSSFELIITILKKASIYSMDKKSYEPMLITKNFDKSRSSRWVLVGYDNKLPILQDQFKTGLDFPVPFESNDTPTVGIVDSLGSLLEANDSSDDSKEFAVILDLFKSKSYAETVRAIDAMLDSSGERSIFFPELMVMKIRALDKLGKNEKEIIEIAKIWTRAYTTHKDLPEMMLILARNQMEIGQNHDAVYFLDTIIREFSDTHFADIATVFRSDRKLAEGKLGEATIGYEKVLFNTTSIEAASLAASRLAEIAIRADEVHKASELYAKILKSNPEFFLQDRDRSVRLLHLLADHKIYDSAANLAKILYQEDHEDMLEKEKELFQLARWQYLGGYEKLALETYEKFLEEFPYSKDHKVAEKELDILQLELGVEDEEKAVALYDKIIKNYPDDESASKALYYKAKVFIKNGRYAETKELLGDLDRLDRELFFDYDQQIRSIEKTLLNSFLLTNQCQNAVELIRERNLGLTLRNDETLYRCAFESKDFEMAIDVANYNINKTTPAQATPWIERKMDSLLQSGLHQQFIDQSERFIIMKRALRESIDERWFYDLFNTYYRFNPDYTKLKKLAETIEYRYPKALANLEIFYRIALVAKKEGDIKTQYEYSKKLINKARLSKLSTYTPTAELTFAEAAVASGMSEEAVQALDTTDLAKVASGEKSRVLFTLGELLIQQNKPDQARARFEECAKVEKNSWSELCEAKL